jgi:hypothetical protein
MSPQVADNTFIGTTVAVSIMMSREQARRGRWSFPRWKVLGVVASGRDPQAGSKRTLVRCEDNLQQYLWTGFSVELHRDGGESYWSNLTATQPALFVVCREDREDGTISPLLVTADYDEAGAYGEGDDQVFAVPMPPEVQRWLERYVVEHYRPQEKKKRRRKP